MLWAAPGLAADRITLNFSSLNLSLDIPVADLRTFAQTGELKGNLATYAQLAPAGTVANFRTLLQQNFQLSPTLITQFAKSVTGKLTFRALGEFIQTANNQNGQTLLVTAFAQAAAANPQGLTILDVIQKFPDTTLNIDGQLSFQAVKTLGQRFRERTTLFDELQKLAQAAPSVNLPTPANPSQPGSSRWVKQTLPLNAQALGISQSVPVDFYLPQKQATPTPVVVIAFGFASNRGTFAYLAEHLASQGFAVVVPSFPYTDTRWINGFLSGTVTPPASVDLAISQLLRPRGITLLLNDLAQKVKTDPSFAKVNPQQVGLLGQSLGGYTVLASAGAGLNFAKIDSQCQQSQFEQLILSFNVSLLFQCQLVQRPTQWQGVNLTNPQLGDPRVKAVIAINPLTSAVFGQQGMGQIKVPTMLISGSDDIFAPPVQEQIVPMTWLTTPDRYLFFLINGTHFSFLGDATASGGLPIPAEMIGPNPTLAQPALKAISTAFFRNYLLNQTQYRPYLNQSFVQTLVPQPFGVNFLTSLSAKQLPASLQTNRNGYPTLTTSNVR